MLQLSEEYFIANSCDPFARFDFDGKSARDIRLCIKGFDLHMNLGDFMKSFLTFIYPGS